MDSVVGLYQQRQYLNGNYLKFEKAFHVNLFLAKRLGMEQELEGHRLCVNCLQWSDCGELLASGSDDCDIILWDIVKRKKKATIHTNHEGNIFTVKFLPYSSNNIVASGAGDAVVKVHDVTRTQQLQNFSCHSRRIKRLAVSKSSPFLLWSSSEDGTVREFDLRTPHACSSRIITCKNVIINLNDIGTESSEVKCVQLHPYFPHLIAVGASDPFVRLYDRRMLSLVDASRSKFGKNQVRGCISYFAPGHFMHNKNRERKSRRFKHYTTTYVSFSPDGEELLQNLGGEHVYTYNIYQNRKPLVFSGQSHHHTTCTSDQQHASRDDNSNKIKEKNGLHKNTFTKNGLTSTFEMRKASNFVLKFSINSSPQSDLPKKALKLKEEGNRAFESLNYFQAIVCYNEALKLVPECSILHANRGAALLKRNWDGDVYAALRDCQTSVRIDPSHSKAFFRQARCLFELNWLEEAKNCLQEFKEKFPDQTDGSSVKKLQTEISQRIKQSKTENDEEDSDSGEQSHHDRIVLNEDEQNGCDDAIDYDLRFVGSCNTTTDIKEVNYFGRNGQFIIAGSDCGCMLMWDRTTTNLIEAWQGDDAVVNCLQPHPTTCLIATSGLDPVVRLWSPRPQNGCEADTRAKEVEDLARANQKRMNLDPLEEMLRTMGYRPSNEADDSNDEEEEDGPVHCRTS